MGFNNKDVKSETPNYAVTYIVTSSGPKNKHGALEFSNLMGIRPALLPLFFTIFLIFHISSLWLLTLEICNMFLNFIWSHSWGHALSARRYFGLGFMNNIWPLKKTLNDRQNTFFHYEKGRTLWVVDGGILFVKVIFLGVILTRTGFRIGNLHCQLDQI